MQSVLLRGELSPADLGEVVEAAGAEIQDSAAYAFGSTRIYLTVGRKHFFRTNSYLGVVLLAATDGATQRIDIAHAGGGSGLMGIEWGSGDDLEGEIAAALGKLIRDRGLTPLPVG